MQQIVQNYFLRLGQMAKLYKNFAIRHNPLIALKQQLLTALKDFLNAGKKKKLTQYRLSSQLYKIQKMEQIIAQSNEHLFLQGRKVNEIR